MYLLSESSVCLYPLGLVCSAHILKISSVRFSPLSFLPGRTDVSSRLPIHPSTHPYQIIAHNLMSTYLPIYTRHSSQLAR